MAEKGKCQVCSKMSEFRCSWCRLVFYCSQSHQKQDWVNHKTSCTKKKYSIDQNEKLDRHLIATEDIKADYILLKDKAIFLSIKANSLEFTPNKICLGCYKEIKEESDEDSSSTESESGCRSKICEKCELPICSPQCASQYFHKHFECRLISEAQPLADDPTETPSDGNESSDSNKPGESSPTKTNSTPSNPTSSTPATSIYNRNNLGIRETILRNLIYFRCILLKYANEKHWDEMMSLKSNEEGRGDLPSLERTTRVFAILKGILSRINHPTINQVSKPDVHKILGILDVNALHFNIFKEVELSALFPTFSTLEHSCAPNCKFYLYPIPTTTISATNPTSKGSSNKKYLFELYCRSSVKIKKGENLSVSYVNLMWNTDKRREFLKKERLFWCKCPRCMDPQELGSHFSTILCPQEGCKAFSVPILKSPENPQDIHWKCTKCGKLTQPWLVKKIDNRLCEMVGNAKPNLKSYQELLTKVEQLVHPDYYLNFIVNHSLIQMFGEDETTIHDKALLEEKVALSNRLLHIIKKLDPGLAKLNIYTAVIYYEMQAAILAMAGAEVDDDYKILRHKPETVKLAKVYLQKCIDCFKYEFLDVPENKLKNLAQKKTEYLDFVLKFKN